MVLPTTTRPSFPWSQSLPSGNFHKPLSLSVRGQTERKLQSQKTNQTDHMDHSLVWLNETMSHVLQGNPRLMAHGGEFWQELHWSSTGEVEWQTMSAILPWELHEHYEKAKRYDMEGWTPQNCRQKFMILCKDGHNKGQKQYVPNRRY